MSGGDPAGRGLLGRARAAVRLPDRLVGAAVAAPAVPRPHAVLDDAALQRALTDLGRARAGEPVEQGHVPDAVAWSLARRVADPARERSAAADREVDGVVDLVDPDDRSRLVGALLANLDHHEQVARSVGGHLVALAGALTDSQVSTHDQRRLYWALVDPAGRLVAWRWSNGVVGDNRIELRDASGALLLVQARGRAAFDWDWADGTPGPWTPFGGPPWTGRPDVREHARGPALTVSSRLPDRDGVPWWSTTVLPQPDARRRAGVQALRLLPHPGCLTCEE